VPALINGVLKKSTYTAIKAWMLAGVSSASWADITGKPTTFAPIIGSGSGDAVAGNDSRLTNARTPTAHTHPLAELTGVTPAAIGAEPAKGPDDNFVTDAEKAALHPAETASSIATALNAGTQDSTAADTDRIAITSPAGGWMTLATLWPWITTKLGALTSLTAGGAWAFSSTTRPTSSGTGTPADTSLITDADARNRWVSNMTQLYYRQQMGLEAGPWGTVGASPAYTLDGNSQAGCRFIGTTALASSSAQGGGIKYPDGGITGGSMTLLSLTWDMRFMFRNNIAAVATATAYFMSLRNSTDFWSNSSIGLYHVAQPVASWAASTAYILGDRINVAGIVFICSTAGTSGGSEPSWGTTLNGTTADNTAVWRHLGPHTSNKWALGIVSSVGVITLTDTGVAWVSGTVNTTLLYLRSDGTNVYGSVNGSAEFSVARGALLSATPFIMCRGDTGGTSSHRIGGLVWSFAKPTQ
jgi:hypothetical protein